jgi:RimJ/RimL family protein N-acetyltransferase
MTVELARLANNKRYGIFRDYIPFPYTIKMLFLYKYGERRKTYMTFAIEFDKNLCGVIAGWSKDVIENSRGYWIGEPYWNKGIATVAVKLITE